ncbi:uncharacterized protein [Onthophagus taurus]|uniref:uncharacterized protein isoform X1 n=2 Tax=Onthophagus taurus TaxID=166361 RepID=UPI0039BDB4F4
MSVTSTTIILPDYQKSHVYYKDYRYTSIQRIHDIGKMRGVKRVALFCIMTTVIPTILIVTPLYLRHSVFADVRYPVTESDVVEIKEGISSVFCDSHTLAMNTSFNAFKLEEKPVLSSKRKHIRLKKSMSLPDDTLEYWGFYLLKGATVRMKVCSRYEGSRILVVRGEKNLKTCGLMEHNMKKYGPTLDVESTRVKITFETAAQEIKDSVEKNKGGELDLNTAEENLDIHENLDVHKNLGVTKTEKSHKKRHTKQKHHKRSNHKDKILKLKETLEENEKNRTKREVGVLLDGRIEHGGNAFNFTPTESTESVSSFESGLLACYDGSILVSQSFPPSNLCDNVQYLEQSEHMSVEHEVNSDGFYYYIFFSDNDFIINDIHAVFDIYKPTYQYSNVSKNFECIHNTTCTFPVSFWSDQSVIVEVPTRDGIDHEEDDITLLISTCHPRKSVYMIFPIAVVFLVLGCAFL